jgi:late competence protein required for DNA uptake (superfamily II DNA/RNA helicase)
METVQEILRCDRCGCKLNNTEPAAPQYCPTCIHLLREQDGIVVREDHEEDTAGHTCHIS